MEKKKNVTETIFKAIVRGVGELKGRKAIKKAMEIIAEQHVNGLVACCGFGCQRVCPVCRACSQDTPDEHAMCSEITYQIAELGNVSPTKTAKEKKSKSDNGVYQILKYVSENLTTLSDMNTDKARIEYISKEMGFNPTYVGHVLTMVTNYNAVHEDLDGKFSIIYNKK